MGHLATRRVAPSSGRRSLPGTPPLPPLPTPRLLPRVHPRRLSAGGLPRRRRHSLRPLRRPPSLRQPCPAATAAARRLSHISDCCAPHRLLRATATAATATGGHAAHGPQAAHCPQSGQRQVCPDRAPGQAASPGDNYSTGYVQYTDKKENKIFLI